MDSDLFSEMAEVLEEYAEILWDAAEEQEDDGYEYIYETEDGYVDEDDDWYEEGEVEEFGFEWIED